LWWSISTKLYLRTLEKTYLSWALKEWLWFNSTGMINSENLINDGLDATCKNNKRITWTYNQGVILSGLVDLYYITKEDSYLILAKNIANAAIKYLVDSNSILKEACELDNTCDTDRCQFKGIFIRNLYYLYNIHFDKNFKEFILHNVDSIWAKSRTPTNKIGLSWNGPVGEPNACTHSSAQDALNSAIKM